MYINPHAHMKAFSSKLREENAPPSNEIYSLVFHIFMRDQSKLSREYGIYCLNRSSALILRNYFSCQHHVLFERVKYQYLLEDTKYIQ